jgi:hypothetical protein
LNDPFVWLLSVDFHPCCPQRLMLDIINVQGRRNCSYMRWVMNNFKAACLSMLDGTDGARCLG